MIVANARYTELQRTELRVLVELASEITAHNWSMRTFIHHNILHGLEYLGFEEAIQRGQQLIGARGYLPNELYRTYFRQGRIRPDHVEAALQPLAQDTHVTIGGRRVTHLEVLRAHLVQGISAPAGETLEALFAGAPKRDLLNTPADRLRGVLTLPSVEARMQAAVNGDLAALGHHVTLAGWCDRVLGTQLWARINEVMIKWCAAFLDEGQATWAMPHREETFYRAWKRLAIQDRSCFLLGISDWRQKLADLPDQPEDAILDSLAALGLPNPLWQDYCSLHLAALFGWAGFIKWRAERPEPVSAQWAKAYPMDLVQYLAVRLWYEREFVYKACREDLGIEGTYGAISGYIHREPGAYFLRRERVAGNLPARYARQVDRLRDGWPTRGIEAWQALARRYAADSCDQDHRIALQSAAWRLVALAKALAIESATLLDSAPSDLKTLLDWLEAFPESQHGLRWLMALEAGYQETLLAQLMANARKLKGPKEEEAGVESNRLPVVRPQAQVVFCIDVRSEVYRRHLEEIGHYETLGFPGFFICFIRYRAFGSRHEVESFPVIMKCRNVAREIPRSYHGEILPRHRAGAQLVRTGHTLLHDLKAHVITPYVMVESLGWFYSLPFFGKTLFPVQDKKASAWLKRLFAPRVSTTLTVDKLSKSDAEEMMAAEQRAIIRRALRERLGLHGSQISPELVEASRLWALDEYGSAEPVLGRPSRLLDLSVEKEAAFIEDLREHYRIERGWAAARIDRITQMGLTLDEQAFTVETALRILGLTRIFARLVLLCAHTSTSDNNPFEAALDCGACGGNEGKPNARLFAAMANKAKVREQLAKHGIEIPQDTYFIAGQVDTATDEVELFDLEDVPPTHRKDVSHLLQDLKEMSRLTSQERCSRLPGVGTETEARKSLRKASRHVRVRSADWSQVRPEWGLSRNAAFIIGSRRLTRGLNLEGRTFMNNYSYLDDPTARLLEILMTAPQMVGQWITMEHYFSTVDNDIYGSGSKVYHNVVGRISIMFGTQSDLRIGLAWQTVMNGEQPYHEPMRMLTIVEAPLEPISLLIQRHPVLQHFYDGRWVHLVAVDPEELTFHRYIPKQGWQKLNGPAAGGNWSFYPWHELASSGRTGVKGVE